MPFLKALSKAPSDSSQPRDLLARRVSSPGFSRSGVLMAPRESDHLGKKPHGSPPTLAERKCRLSWWPITLTTNGKNDSTHSAPGLRGSGARLVRYGMCG